MLAPRGPQEIKLQLPTAGPCPREPRLVASFLPTPLVTHPPHELPSLKSQSRDSSRGHQRQAPVYLSSCLPSAVEGALERERVPTNVMTRPVAGAHPVVQEVDATCAS